MSSSLVSRISSHCSPKLVSHETESCSQQISTNLRFGLSDVAFPTSARQPPFPASETSCWAAMFRLLAPLCERKEPFVANSRTSASPKRTLEVEAVLEEVAAA